MIGFQRGVRKIIRAIVLACFVVVAIILGGAYSIVTYGTDTLIPWISGEVAGQIDRQVVIQGIHLSLLRGLVLEGVKVSEHPTFREGVFAESRQMTMKPDFWELIFGRLAVKDLRLYEAMVHLRRNPQGKWNLEGIAKHQENQPKVLVIDSPDIQQNPLPFGIADFEIHGGEFVLEDAMGKLPRMRFKGIGMEVEKFPFRPSFSIFSFFSVQFSSYNIAGSAFPIGAFVSPEEPLYFFFKGQLRLDNKEPEKTRLTIKNLELKTGSWTLSSRGELDPVRFTQARLDVKARFKDFKLAETSTSLKATGEMTSWLRLNTNKAVSIPPAADADSAHSTDSTNSPQAGLGQAEFTTGVDQSFAWGLDATNLDVQWESYLNKQRNSPLQFAVKGTHLQASATEFHQIQGSMEFLMNSALPGSIGHWALAFKPKTKKEKASDDDKEFPTWEDSGGLEALRAPRWTFVFSSAAFQAESLSLLFPQAGDYLPTNGLMLVESFQAVGGNGFWNADIKNISLKEAATQRPGQRINAIDMGLASVALKGEQAGGWDAQMTGALTLNGADTPHLVCKELIAQGNLTNIGTTPQSKINGELHVHLTDGVLRDIPGLVTKAPFMKFLIQPLKIFEDLNNWGVLKLEGQDFASLPMESMQGDYYFDYGRMNLEKITVKGPLANVQVSGKVDFPNDQINLLVVVNVPKKKLRWAVPDAFTDDKGLPYMHIKVKGSLKKPEVYPVLGKKKDMLKELNEQLDLLREKTKNILSKIFK